MVTFLLGNTAVADVRFGVSPLVETTLSLRVLISPERFPLQIPWERRARSRLCDVDTATLMSVLNVHGHTPDVLTPPPSALFPVAGAEFETLREIDPDLLAAFFADLPRSTAEAAALAVEHDDKISGDRVLLQPAADLPLRHALEPRHRSFECEEARALLAEHDIAAVVADTGGRFVALDAVTSGFVYVRLHGPAGLYDSPYHGTDLLPQWAERFRAHRDAGRDVFVYFDNDGHCHAPWDARALVELL